MGWQVNTVYAKRLRSVRKLAEHGALSPTDLPTGEHVGGRLRWRAAELKTYVEASRRSRNRGGRPRAPKTRLYGADTRKG